MNFDFFYGNQADQFSFIRIPREILVNPAFEPLCLESKLLYGLLLDRMSLSMRNAWFDSENRVYIIYPISELQKDLHFTKKKAMKLLQELESFGLIQKRKRGRGLPDILYIKSFLTAQPFLQIADDGAFEDRTDRVRSAEIDTSESQMADVRGAKNDTSGGAQNAPPEVPKSTPLKSKIYNNQTYLINISSNLAARAENALTAEGCDADEIRSTGEYAELIAENIELDCLKQKGEWDEELLDGVYELILETVVCRDETIVISSSEYPAELVRSKFLKLNSAHIEYVLDCFLQNSTRVKNIKKYMLAALFNAPSTMSAYYTSQVHHDMPYLVEK